MTLRRLYYSFPTLHELPYFVPPGLFWRQRAATALTREVVGQELIEGKILEIGCGSGFLSQRMANMLSSKTIYGIDASGAMISYAAARNRAKNLRFLVLDFLEIGTSVLTSERFAAIVSLNVWPFFPLEESLRVVKQVSSHGTRFVAVTYCRTNWSRFHRGVLSSLFRRPLYIHEPAEFLSALSKFGFQGTYIPIDRLEGSYLVSTVLVG